ncbi:nucleoside 2-deoxyribosyltransferase [Streptomyces buecherae]|uniref:Nucleoside 2-deoxyribosyltransferase n=1 Tax=Streptomyces buecherae TaxID=2763006 RepID=A0A7H8NGN3_9ACTN|nr:nucleoside 2-deoxyribosyltransferase [Streptomyces buecherae]QKW53556.1 nucleoside 2-deoxyribosyltransferase [Streptomyces buecherae]
MSVYVAHRLFAAHDRALAADLADRLSAKIGAHRVFLPFCDTDEEGLVAEVKGRRLFELDRARLGDLDAMVAILHGPSLDDGVCMEIGYAAASGVPIIVLTTDFQTYSLDEAGPHLEFPDPLFQAVATRVVRVTKLGPPNLPSGLPPSRFASFRARNTAQTSTALGATVDALLNLPAHAPRLPALPSPRGTVHVEASPYAAWGHDHLARACTEAGHTTTVSQRFTSANSVTGALADLSAACSATRLLADVSGPETPPGTALLIGAAAAGGARIAAYQPRPTFTHAHGREPNWRNLMIQYAAEAHLDTDDALRSWLAT